jgi:hypothetical protein
MFIHDAEHFFYGLDSVGSFLEEETADVLLHISPFTISCWKVDVKLEILCQLFNVLRMESGPFLQPRPRMRDILANIQFVLLDYFGYHRLG